MEWGDEKLDFESGSGYRRRRCFRQRDSLIPDENSEKLAVVTHSRFRLMIRGGCPMVLTKNRSGEPE